MVREHEPSPVNILINAMEQHTQARFNHPHQVPLSTQQSQSIKGVKEETESIRSCEPNANIATMTMQEDDKPSKLSSASTFIKINEERI